MYNNGMAISEVDRERVVIKVPVTSTGAEAAAKLTKAGVRICFTACYNRNQALIAASSGVSSSLFDMLYFSYYLSYDSSYLSTAVFLNAT